MDLSKGPDRQLGVSMEKDENLSPGYRSSGIHLFGPSFFAGDLNHRVAINRPQRIFFRSPIHDNDLTPFIGFQAIQAFDQVMNIFSFVKYGHNN
jgi:hypothetical protein